MFVDRSSQPASPRRDNDPFAEARQNLFPPVRNKILAQAAGALSENNIERTRSLVSAYLMKKPRDAAALNLMADIARRSQRFDEAEELLSRCVELSPETAGYRFNFAIILRRREKHEEALAELNALLLQYPGNPLFLEQKAA